MGPSHNDIAENTSEGKATAAVNPEAAPGIKIPAILFEGDEPTPRPEEIRPEPKFAVGPGAQQPVTDKKEAELPLGDDTGRLWLAARDPRGLYAHWDLPTEHSKLEPQPRLTLRVHLESLKERPLVEIPLPPEARHLFVPVAFPGRGYIADLGYYPIDHDWQSIVVSEPVTTPPEGISQDKTVIFATIQPPSPGSQAAPQSPSLAPPTAPQTKPAKVFPLPPVAGPGSGIPTAVAQISQEARLPSCPGKTPIGLSLTPAPEWTAQQELALGELMGWDLPGSPSSAEMIDLLQWRVSELEDTLRNIELSLPQVSSPAGAEVPGPRDFWLSVNAELVIFGATLPNARISIGGRPIQLRPDGTFSYRLALPDGHYELPIEAAAADGDLRRALLEFYRRTSCQGEVRPHPQSPEPTNPQAGTCG